VRKASAGTYREKCDWTQLFITRFRSLLCVCLTVTMSPSGRAVLLVLMAATILTATSLAQPPEPLPGCEPAPEIRKVLNQELNGKELEKMPFADRVARRRDVYEKLIADNPREVEPYRGLIEYTRRMQEYLDPNPMSALQERFREQAKQSPGDPLALYVAGVALFGTDTPESLRLLEASKTKASQFPWPFLALAEDYSDGKLMDKQRSSENLTAFFALCPASMEGTAQQLLARNNKNLGIKVALALRARLAKETDPQLIENYEMLWGVEFRSRPPQEHDAQRNQVAADLERIRSMNPKPDSEWAAFLIRGYQQAGLAPEKITPMEDRLLRDYPHSDDAYDIVHDRWRDSHPRPEGQKDAVAWAKYHEAHAAAVNAWRLQFPDDSHFAHGAWIWLADDDFVAEKDGLAAVDENLRYNAIYGTPSERMGSVANFLLKHKWQPGRALDLLENVKTIDARAHALQVANDDLQVEVLEELNEQQLTWDLRLEGQILKAAQLAGRPDAAEHLKSVVDGPPPTQEKLQSDYWWNRARLASIENRMQDALAFYQLSLHTRLESPEYSGGKLRDDLTDEASALWKQMGGTSAAWAVWSSPLPSQVTARAQGTWEKPKKTFPDFALSDLSGKTWRLNDLKGKVLLINVWATWCGPCREELPRLQQLYEQLQGRSDIQVLALDIDEDVGQVAPYVKDKRYTFPVIPAYAVVNDALDWYVPIPQNWILDSNGKWLWTRFGYDEQDNWAQVMIQKLESAKTRN
jgi:thiol-disulfide isomerase/thioredoxin